LGVKHGTALLLCSAASARRMGTDQSSTLPAEFSEAGLVQMWDIARRCDHVLTF